MAQLGSGNGSGYPSAIDSRQTFRNSAAPAPDSDTRLDAEVVNDSLAAHIAVQTTLGANPQGTFGSVAARLNQFLPGGGIAPNSVPFTNATTLTIPGTIHRLGTSTILFQIYDAAIPAAALAPDAFTVLVNPATYDVTITFQAAQSGSVVLSAAPPLYTTTFTTATTLNIPGTTHLLGTTALFFVLFSFGPLM